MSGLSDKVVDGAEGLCVVLSVQRLTVLDIYLDIPTLHHSPLLSVAQSGGAHVLLLGRLDDQQHDALGLQSS